MKRNSSLADELQIIKSFTKDVPYRFVKGNKDYTPERITHPKFVEIKGKFDMSDFVSLFVCENFIPTNYPIFLNEDRSSLITGLLTGSRYGPSTFPLKTILRPEPMITSKKKKIDTTLATVERRLINPFVEETFQVSLVETRSILLFSQDTSVNVFEIEGEERAKHDEELIPVKEEEEEELEIGEIEPEGEVEEEEEEEPIITMTRQTLLYSERGSQVTRPIAPLELPSSEEEEEEKIEVDIEGIQLDEPFKDTGTNPEEPFYLEIAINTDNPIQKNRLIGVSPYIMYCQSGIEIEDVTRVPYKYEDPRLIKADYEDISTCVLDSSAFYFIFHSIEKLLEAKFYRKEQTIYNNASLLDDLPKDQKFALIFTFKQPKKLKPNEECEVTSLAWHPLLKYLIGVGYGKMHQEKKARGMFCIWNIKNPSFPERMYHFKHGVTSFSFSKEFPYAVALTFHNGQMMIINILTRKLIQMCDNSKYMKDNLPNTHIKWFLGSAGDYYPVTSSKSGDMYMCKVDKFLYLDLMLSLPRKYGETKGIKQCLRLFPGDEDAKPHKIGISTFTQHPNQSLIYLVGTDDGYVHVCSKVFKMRDTDVFAAHEGPITNIEFHQVTDKLFLTSGNDYHVRVWAYLVYTPLICFSTNKELVRYAKWATFNTMQIVAMGEIYLDVWDLRRINHSVPICTYENTERSNNLIFNISPFGPHIVLGDEKGVVQLLIYNETKFEPAFKVEILARALRNHVKCRNATLWRQVEELVPEFKVENIHDDNIDIIDLLDE